ncbi:tRNA glutamyl-Q(34) synthetase GluQRS [Candidatus Phycosocius spiralis]|uniref:tRNA glutamyl-Q(34) synthetase GluQRS n=1 Tax=Candidatus Phycosocius spiralis TaxID=2815099 RepID=A0ABQ4PSV8_9PROT|nr:tRNA glutamyl-Q(34) synthetase GluQRS [Candidatus Phycosocius spiralis]GIU66075.1 tRNA glutamyl-Q(34) synthetase GluQRS [Candidatus Phycosocius spiralis]
MFTTRFAPSPTGYLHLGHAFSAWTAFEAAQQAKGRFILRIEDSDQTRCRPEFEAAIYEDLAWLGLSWEQPVRRQSEHMDEYQAALSQLESLGLIYRCFKTRKSLMADIAAAPHGPVSASVDHALTVAQEARLLAENRPFAWRLSLSRCRQYLGARWEDLGFLANGNWVKADLERLGDVVLGRKEFPSSYHLASVLDDAAQGITHVIRGEDLADVPHLHVLLQVLFDLPTPEYHHHRLILDADGKRYAKRNQAVTLRSMRENGTSPNQIRALVGL